MNPILSVCCLLWAAWIVLVYVSVLVPEISPGIVAGILPVFSGKVQPSFAGFAGKSVIIAVSIAAALYSGRVTGRGIAAFLRLGKIGDLRMIPLGWMAISFAYLGLGLTGLWQPGTLAVAAAVLALANLPGRWMRPRFTPELFSSPVVLIPALLAGWSLLIMSIAPEVYQDPLRYHLFLPEQFLLAHKCFFMPDFFFWSYFGPIHALYAAAYSIGGRLAAQSVNLAAAFLSIAAVLRIAKAVGLSLGDRRLTLGLFLSAPGLLLVTGSTFAEHGHALYVILALEWLLASEAPRPLRMRAVALLAGQAFAAKYTAAFGIAGLGAVLMSLPDRRAWAGALLRPAVLILGLMPFLPWGVWNWIHTLDPVSPTLGGLGFATHDHSSMGALKRYYGFVHVSWLSRPARLLSFPIEFAGAHVSYWECPGPAVPGMLLAALLAVRYLPVLQRGLAVFCLGGIVAWMVLLGGGSPHYVAGYNAAWVAACLGAVSVLTSRTAVLMRNMLVATVFFQLLVGFATVKYLSDPRDYVFGVETRPDYLKRMLPPANVAYPLRNWLNERLDRERDRVLVYGDDNGSYLNFRVRLDLERADRLLLWRFAEESFGPDEVRRRLKQRGFSWMVYSLHWSVLLATEETLEHSTLSPRALRVLQDFWRIWADPVIGAYPELGVRSSPAWAVRFRDKPRRGPVVLDRWRQPELLPGTLPWFWLGVERERKEDHVGAIAAYQEVLERYPGYAMAQLQIARLLFEQGRLPEAKHYMQEARKLGWILKDSESWIGEMEEEGGE